MINDSFDPMDTPGKKRKRDTFSKFTSSTPIKLSNKENCLFSDTLCMEVKSIADLVAERQKKALPVSDYEVIRKPPKKKKKISPDQHCFVNPGLDLKVDSEKVINPFEVIRDDDTEAKQLAQGISNPALDVNYDIQPPQTVTNPFEVVRDVEVSKLSGIDNVACETNNRPTQRALALVLPLPFTPTVNHRIDFSKMPDNLTPSTLLSSKLVLENNEAKITLATPKRITTIKASKSLSIISEISEEENELDIGEELDNYQLQLENSINEAKMQNRKYKLDASKTIEEEKPTNERGNATYTKEILQTIEESAKELEHVELKESNVDSIENVFSDTNDDVQFEEVDSFEDIQKLGQFKRAYRTDVVTAITKVSDNNEEENQQNKEKKSSKIGSTIRRSIRKFIHPKSSSSSEGKLNEDNEKSSENEKHDGIFQTIRQSLRRKHKPKIMQDSLETSIVGRQVFRQETANDEPAKTLERQSLKRNIVKTMKTFLESVEEFEHY